MPTITVNGVTLAYECLGNGPPIVWTPGGWLPRDEWSYFNAGCLAADYTVLLWDRRNTGASELAIEDAASEYELWADDLHHLLAALRLSPAYLAGGSAGSQFSLIMAQRYPEDVQGLILIDAPTNDQAMIKAIFDAHYLTLAEVAATQGMEAVIAHSAEAWQRMAFANAQPGDWLLNWVAMTISMNPSNYARLLAMEPHAFATIMKKWGAVGPAWAAADRCHLGGLSAAQLGQLTMPALIVQGFDPIHPKTSAEALYRLLPNATWVEFAAAYDQATLAQMAAPDASWQAKALLAMPFIRKFLQSVAST
ncbi:MAG: alpha/beta hydrolase [Caldilineaceae bacterium]|nr:alpha/beta hydrolase [Caldilineaceae bacterium]